MAVSASHSWATQGWFAVVYENRSALGIEWVVQMSSPTLRCHQRSGSSKRLPTVRTVRTVRANLSTTGNENAARRKQINFDRETAAGASCGTTAFQSAVAVTGSCGIDMLRR